MGNLCREVLSYISSKEWIFCFCITFIVGFITNIVVMVNNYYNHDAIVLYGNNMDWLISQGKWFVTPLASMEGELNISYLSSIIGLIWLSLAVALLCKLFAIKNKASVYAIAVCFVTFPSVATEMLYQGADYFGAAFFMAVLGAAMIIQGGVLVPLVGIIFVCFSVGAYQANLGVAMTILIIDCIMRIPQDSYVKTSLLRIVKYVSALAVSAIGYYVILKLTLFEKGIELSSYKGIDNMTGNLTPEVLFESAIKAYSNMLGVVACGKLNINGEGATILGCVFLVLCLSFMVLFIGSNRAPHDAAKIGVTVFLFFCIPLGANIIGVLSANSSFYYITIQAFCLVYSIPVILGEALIVRSVKTGKGTSLIKVMRVLAILCLMLISWRWVVQNNIVFSKVAYINQEIDAKIPVLISEIQNIDGYDEEDEVLFIENTPYDFLEANGALRDYDNLYNMSGYGLGNSSGEIYSSGMVEAF